MTDGLPAMLDAFVDAVGRLRPAYFYLALFVSAYVENIFPPVPGDTVTVFAAYVVGRTKTRILGVFVSTTLGSVAGFMTYYAIGRLLDPDYFMRRNFRFLPAASFEAAGRWFQRYGWWVVLVNRFLTGIRGVISIATGLYRLPWGRTLVLACFSCAVWNGLLIWAGYLLGANWRAIEGILQQYSRAVALLLLGAFAVWLLRRRASAR